MLDGHPAPLRWLVGLELARHRAKAKLSLTEVSAQVGFSRAKIGHMETGRQAQDPKDLRVLLGYYGAGDAEIEPLIELLGREGEADWWRPWAKVVPDWLAMFLGLERLARSEFVFEPVYVPGLLQTPDYATAMSTATPRLREDHVERFADLRMHRARRLLDDEQPLQLHAVLTQGALDLAVGDDKVRRDQLRHIVELGRRPNVTLQVARPADGVRAVTTGHFALLDLDAVGRIGFAELIDDAVYVRDSDRLAAYDHTRRTICQTALDPERSINLIASMIEV